MSFIDYSETDDRALEKKPWAYVLVLTCLLVILAIRLFQIQVYNYHLYLDKSEDYRLKRIVIEAPRGFIYDRNGEMLATNRMSYSVTIDPFEIDRFDETVPHLASLIPDLPTMFGASGTALVDSMKILSRKTRNPSIIVPDADWQTISLIEELSIDLPGVGCEIGQRRFYPHGPLACHIIGYMGKLTGEETETLTEEGYYKNQWIGRSGIEKYYEPVLKGKNGKKFLEKNYLNRFLGPTTEYKPDPAIPGRDITLTIDYRLQMAAEEAFGDTICGSFVALDPRNGEVLVLASFPQFDLNKFTSIMSQEQYAVLYNNEEKPLYNRAVQGTYPPGSTFKMLTALAGLSGGITENTKFQSCQGTYYFGREYKCWKESGHGSLNMIDAIIQSCNVYYYQLGRRIGLEQWSQACAALGFGRETGIDLFNEKRGNLPSPEFYTSHGIVYSPGMILNLSIGQGENDVTPLQLARYTAILANGGFDVKPHLLMGNGDAPHRKPGLSPAAFDVVRRGMHGVVNHRFGTARNVRIPGLEVAGKTGTSQNPHGEDHKIFIAFAPYEHPAIATACIAENTGHITPSLAVTITRKVLAEFAACHPEATTLEE